MCRELLAALRLVAEGHVQQGFMGSEAGAVGQCQVLRSERTHLHVHVPHKRVCVDYQDTEVVCLNSEKDKV